MSCRVVSLCLSCRRFRVVSCHLSLSCHLFVSCRVMFFFVSCRVSLGKQSARLPPARLPPARPPRARLPPARPPASARPAAGCRPAAARPAAAPPARRPPDCPARLPAHPSPSGQNKGWKRVIWISRRGQTRCEVGIILFSWKILQPQ